MEQELTKLAELEQRCRSNTRRIDDLERKQEVLQRLTTAVEVLATEQRHLRKNVDAMSGKIDALEKQPGKRWETVVEQVVTMLVTAAVTYYLVRLGVSA